MTEVFPLDWFSVWISLLCPFFSVFPSFLPRFAFSPFAAWWVFYLLLCYCSSSHFLTLSNLWPFSSDPILIFCYSLPALLSSLWPFPSLFILLSSCNCPFQSILPSEFCFSTPAGPRGAFLSSKLACLASFHCNRLSCFSSLKHRLSSLTTGDSDRRSSASQQRELTADVSTESTSNFLFRVFPFLLD